MSKVISAHAVSVDGYTPSAVFGGFKLSEPSARVFDALAGRVGAIVAGRNTYEDSDRFSGGSPHPAARLVLLSHRPAPEVTERQILVTTGIEDAIAAAARSSGRSPSTCASASSKPSRAAGVTHLHYAVER